MTKSRSGGQVLVAGSANVDFVVRASHIPAPGETVLGGDLMVVPGGKGANQAVASARAGGAATTMLVALGDDAFAPMLEKSLNDAGVDLQIVRADRPTGAALITVSEDAENAITVAPGANQALMPDDLPDLDGIGWLVMQLETPIATVTAFAQKARAAGVKVMLNAAPAQKLPPELLAATDVLVANEAELAAIVGDQGAIADQLMAANVPCVIATLGERGCCALADGAFVLQPAFSVEPVDTTAAGDTFVGVLAAALAQDQSLADALRIAAAAAALATTYPGAQSSIPEADAVASFTGSGNTSPTAELVRFCGVTPAGD